MYNMCSTSDDRLALISFTTRSFVPECIYIGIP